ncbi:MAG: hypothetical protein AAF297_07400 [Planctomycetota bacterium]
MRAHRWLVLSVLVAALWGCDRRDTAYDLGTPEGTIEAATGMVAEGRADRLSELIEADSPEMRSLLNQFGRMLGELQRLGEAVEANFPEQVAAMRAEAEAAAAEGQAATLIDRLTGAPARRGSFGVNAISGDDLGLNTGGEARESRGSVFDRGRPSGSQRARFNRLAQEVLIDPYAWLEDGRGRLDTAYVSDGMVALTWDDKTLLPPFGVVLVENEGAWRLVLPTRYPGVREIMPRTADEYAVWGSMVRTLEHVVVDLRRDVERGRVTTLSGLADAAVEKVAIPAALVAFAFSEVMQERRSERADAPGDADEAARAGDGDGASGGAGDDTEGESASEP